jgi:hypothetical protein
MSRVCHSTVSWLQRRRYRKWAERSADALDGFHDAIGVVGQTTPHNLVGVGDHVVAAVRELRAHLAEDHCPDSVVAGVNMLVLDAYTALGTVFVLFEALSRPVQEDALRRVQRLEGEVAALAAVEEPW